MIWEEILEVARILVIDDEEANVRLMERMLGKVGYQRVFSTTDPREAVSLYRAVQPDLVVLDLHMPGLSGFEVMEQLQAELPPDTYLPILVLTADIKPELKLRALLVGAKDFLLKPVDRVEAMLRIRILLETRFLFRSLAERLEPGIVDRPVG